MKNTAIVSDRGTVTIPGAVRAAVHIKSGDFIEFEADPEHDRILLKHLTVDYKKTDELSRGDWDKLDTLVRAQVKKGSYREYGNSLIAKAHSRRLLSKK